MKEDAFDKLYDKFYHYMKKEMGFLACPNRYDLWYWEKFKDKELGDNRKRVKDTKGNSD